MKQIDNNLLSKVSGGWLIQAGQGVAIGAGVFNAPGVANGTTTWVWGQQVGSNLGGFVFEITHPNNLGQMEYKVEDFGYSYIAPISQ